MLCHLKAIVLNMALKLAAWPWETIFWCVSNESKLPPPVTVEMLDATYIHILGSASCTPSLWDKVTARTTWPLHSAALLSWEGRCRWSRPTWSSTSHRLDKGSSEDVKLIQGPYLKCYMSDFFALNMKRNYNCLHGHEWGFILSGIF